MYKTIIIKGINEIDYQRKLNKLFAKAKKFEIFDIKHFYQNFDYIGIITFKKGE